MAEPITNVLGTVAIKHCGEYDATVNYEKLNVVSYEGSSYCATTATRGNLPTNTNYWELMAEKGDKGDTGEEGYTPVKGTDYYTAEDKAELEATLSSDVTSEVTSQLGGLTSASPIAVTSSSQMTDTSRIYVLTTDGHWYWNDGNDWQDGGVYLSSLIDNLYTELLFNSYTDTYKIDTTNHTITIGAGRFLFKNVTYSPAKQTVEYPTTGSAVLYLYYDTTNSTFKIRTMTSTPATTDAIVLLFNRNNFTQKAYMSYKGRYIVDNIVYNDYTNNICEYVSLAASSPVFAFDTVNNRVTIQNIRVIKNQTGDRISPSSQTIDYSSLTQTTLAIWFDFAASNFIVADTNNSTYVNNPRYGLITIFNKNLTDNSFITYKGKISINGKITQEYMEYRQIYVSENGNDENGTGTVSSPFRTLNKALSVKPNEIIISSGEYETTANMINYDLKIKGLYTAYDKSTNFKNKKPTIIFGKKLIPEFDETTNLLKVSYSSGSSDIIYKVFVSHELEPTTEGTRPAYTVTLWISNIDKEKDDIKLIPVLTLQECQQTNNSFYYDGSNIYINDNTNFSNKRYVLSDADIVTNGIYIYNANVDLSNIAFRYATNRNMYTSGALLNARDCEFGNSAQSDGVGLNDSNSNLYNCLAYRNRNDGFNIHGFGNSHFYNCSGFYNEDDGISHHDGTVGYINGGEWNNNHKGGISSPTYGAVVNITDAYCHDNNFGIYGLADSSTSHEHNRFLFNNCLLKNNTTSDIRMEYYDAVAWNNIYDTKNVQNGTLTEY